MLKKEVNIHKDRIIICEFSLTINDKLFVGKKPPEEIRVNAKFKESKVLIEKIFKTIKIKSVRLEYKRKIFAACLSTSELLKEI